jgi:single stranded DNA-binding protein
VACSINATRIAWDRIRFEKENNTMSSRGRRRRDYHTTEIVGRLAAPPEMHYTQNTGTAVTKLRVLVNEQWKDASGNDQRHVEGYRVVTCNGLAEACGNGLGKGSQVFVRGRNRTRSYEKDGGQRYVTEVIAETVLFLDSPKETESQRPAPGEFA